MCAGMGDPIDAGEVIREYPPGTPTSAIHADMVNAANATRGVAFSVDVFSFKLFWERFMSVSYEPGWQVEPNTGIILERHEPAPAIDTRSHIGRERAAFDRDKAKRETAARRAANRGQSKTAKTATNH